MAKVIGMGWLVPSVLPRSGDPSLSKAVISRINNVSSSPWELGGRCHVPLTACS